MNTFFKSTVYAAFIGLTVLSSCEDEIKDFTVDPEETEQGDGNTTTEETKNLIINASINQTATGKTNWVVEDVIYVGSPSAAENAVTIDNQSSGFVKFTVSKIGEGATSASFEGEIPTNLSGKKLLVFYGNAADMKVAASKVTLDLASQNGTLMSATADYAGEESINATFGVENASAELTITTTDLTDVKEAVLSFSENSTVGFTSSKEFNAEGIGTYTMQRSMTVALTAGENNEYTISFMPSLSETPESMTVDVKAGEGSGDYIYSKDLTDVSSSTNSYTINIAKENINNDLSVKLSGEGTEASPYIIDNVDKFKGMTETTGKFYQLSRDLDFTGIEFTPIATFAGTFDGNEKTISNITLNITEGNGGIFAENNGTIKNLTVEESEVTKTGSLENNGGIGILVGINKKELSNCHITNSTLNATPTSTGTDTGIGLLCGKNTSKNSFISECTVTSGNITMEGSTTSNIGGLVGYNYGGKVEFSFVKSSTSITYTSTGAGSNIGGLIGCIYGCNIKGCSTDIKINTKESTSSLKIAGFIGDAFTKWDATATISGCYTIGSLSFNKSNQTYGGFAGSLGGGGAKTLTNCYTSIDFDDSATHAFVGAGNNDTYQKVTATDIYYVKGSQDETKNDNINSVIQQKTAADLKGMASSFNSTLDWTDYQFVAGTTDAEPLIIQKK